MIDNNFTSVLYEFLRNLTLHMWIYLRNLLLSSIYREEEIIMPAEHTGVVKENYKWKVKRRKVASWNSGQPSQCSNFQSGNAC